MAKKVSSGAGEGTAGGLSARDQAVQERLLELRKQHQSLHERKIATEQDRKNLEQRLQELRAQAEREFGTSDIDQLRRLLEERRQENERMVREYQQHIDDIQQRLLEIDSGEEGAGGGQG
jgi:chromosome segregation ATPase